MIFLEEDTGKYMYVIKKGRVKVSRALPTSQAVVPTTILVITRHDFAVLLKNPAVNAMFLKMLCKRCRDAWAQISVLAFHHCTSSESGTRVLRLAGKLLQATAVDTYGNPQRGALRSLPAGPRFQDLHRG